MIPVTCSAVNVPPQPARGASLSTSSMARRNATVVSATLDGDQRVKGILPALSPDSDLPSPHLYLAGDLFVEPSFISRQNDPGPLLRSRTETVDSRVILMEELHLFFRKSNLGCFSRHDFFLP